MKSKSLIIVLLFVLTGYADIIAQLTTKNIIVEHFTNTRCGICASRNPGFYSTLSQNPGVLHIAYHPSAPYSTCLFSTQNKAQNDARTNYYDLFGGTPIFSINGVEKSSSAVQSSSVYNDFKNQTSPIKLDVALAKYGTNKIEVSFDIKMLANNTLGNAKYFVALVEDTVFYNAPNGEKIHFDVFRKSLTSNTSLPSIMLPANEGNMVQFRDQFTIEAIWNLARIYAVVILSDDNKSVLQVAKSPLYNPNILSSTDNVSLHSNDVTVYPNPANNELNVTIQGNETVKSIKIFDISGHEVINHMSASSQNLVDISTLVKGTYLVQVTMANRVVNQKFTKI